jgi:hypothetical protein
METISRRSSRSWFLLLALINGAVLLIAFPDFLDGSAIQMQRLCEHNDRAVAKIAPCFGPVGTAITVTPAKQITSAPAQLVFKRVLANGVPAEVVSSVANSAATAPNQLCARGNGKWDVWLVLANGQRQGKIGAFTVSGCAGGGSTGLANRPPANNNPPIETIILPPITINVDNEVYVKTKNTSQSYLKHIDSTVPEVATATEWGTNDVKVRGKSPGVTTISFFDANTGTVYRVQVTVIRPPRGGDGAIKTSQIDPCLVGEWRTASVSGAVTGGSGFRLEIKGDGTQILDYSSMEILRLHDLTYRYGGAAEGVLKTEDGVARNISITRAEVTLAMGDVNGEQPAKPSKGMGPGALGINKNNNSYTCAADSLKYVTEDFRGNVFLRITMKRLPKTRTR